VVLSPQPWVATCSHDKIIKIWNVETGVLANKLEGHTGYVQSLIFLREANKLVSSSSDETIRVWDLADFTAIILREHKGRIRPLLNLFDRGCFASGGDDATVRVWNLKNLKAGSTVVANLDKEVTTMCYMGGLVNMAIYIFFFLSLKIFFFLSS
jgi:WD40 repeat protein